MSKRERIYIFDTTLRDGEQSPGFSMNRQEKLRIANGLAALGVDIIEAGFPISSDEDYISVREVAEKVQRPVICALARTRQEDIDAAAKALEPAIARGRGRIHAFIATSDVHMRKKLRKKPEEVIGMAVSAIKHARNYTNDIEFSPEDAARTDIDFMCKVIGAAIAAGATTINIPDTVGYAQPFEFGERIKYIFRNVSNIEKAVISVHCHNDLGNAAANSLAGILSGARQVECTINGIGERAGNAALEEIVMNIKTRPDIYNAKTGIKTRRLGQMSELVCRITGMGVQPNKAVVGENAFAHSAGIHQHGIIQDRLTYEIMDKDEVGWKGRALIMGSRSGRHALVNELRALGYSVRKEVVDELYRRFKELADEKKYVYDDDLRNIGESVGLRPRRNVFYLEELEVAIGRMPTATVLIRKDGKLKKEAATGNGPVDATYRAIEKITKANIELTSYRVSSKGSGTYAVGEVEVVIGTNGYEYFGISASTDILEASAKAYINAINRMLLGKFI